jgi:hypothetical protein
MERENPEDHPSKTVKPAHSPLKKDFRLKLKVNVRPSGDSTLPQQNPTPANVTKRLFVLESETLEPSLELSPGNRHAASLPSATPVPAA